MITADDIDAAFVPLALDSVALVEIDDELVLAAPRGVEGAIYSHWLNATGACVWKCFDGDVSLQDLAVELADAFAVAPDDVIDDLIALCRDLGRAGLLDGVEAEAVDESIRFPTLPIGSDVSHAAGKDRDGNALSLAELGGQLVLLVNWSPTCGFCVDLAPQLAALQPALASRKVEIVLAASGSAAENDALLDAAGLECRLLLDAETDVFFGLGTPCAYLVDPDGRTASHVYIGGPPVADFARRITEAAPPAGAAPQV